MMPTKLLLLKISRRSEFRTKRIFGSRVRFFKLRKRLRSDSNFPTRLTIRIRRAQFVFLEKLEAVKASFASHRDADAFSRRGRLRLPACAIL